MANFTVGFTSGVTYLDWLDPASGGLASRINSRPGFPQKRARGVVGIPVVITATVDGVSAPLDSALDGKLFYPLIVEAPIPFPKPMWSSPSGQSSVQTVIPNQVGHYHFRIRRDDGGIVHLHLDVEAS